MQKKRQIQIVCLCICAGCIYAFWFCQPCHQEMTVLRHLQLMPLCSRGYCVCASLAGKNHMARLLFVAHFHFIQFCILFDFISVWCVV